jgi:hypothetical protein
MVGVTESHGNRSASSGWMMRLVLQFFSYLIWLSFYDSPIVESIVYKQQPAEEEQSLL